MSSLVALFVSWLIPRVFLISYPSRRSNWDSFSFRRLSCLVEGALRSPWHPCLWTYPSLSFEVWPKTTKVQMLDWDEFCHLPDESLCAAIVVFYCVLLRLEFLPCTGFWVNLTGFSTDQSFGSAWIASFHPLSYLSHGACWSGRPYAPLAYLAWGAPKDFAFLALPLRPYLRSTQCYAQRSIVCHFLTVQAANWSQSDVYWRHHP